MDREEMAGHLIRLSKAKSDLIRHLYVLTEKQCEALEGDNIEFLEGLIQQKQEIMNKVDVLDKEFIEKFDAVKKSLGVESIEGFTAEPVSGFKVLQGIIDEIIKITEKIYLLDQINNKKARKNFEVIQKQYQSIKTGKKAIKSYGNKFMQNQSVFLDKKE